MKSLLVNAAFLVCSALYATSGQACSLAATEELKVKEKMAAEIADHIGAEVDAIDLDTISAPQVVMPLGLGANCSGINAMHHTAGFRLTYNNTRYEGVAVLLGYWYTNPVAVHFKSNPVN